MAFPSLALALVCALVIGSLFHLVVGGGGAWLSLYLLLSMLGFGAGHWLASSQHWSFLAVGSLQLGPAAAGSMLLLVLGHWLGRRGTPKSVRDPRV
jgi:hypothetical protein